jgi:membrane protease YdiL (CAAX protease family)
MSPKKEENMLNFALKKLSKSSSDITPKAREFANVCEKIFVTLVIYFLLRTVKVVIVFFLFGVNFSYADTVGGYAAANAISVVLEMVLPLLIGVKILKSNFKEEYKFTHVAVKAIGNFPIVYCAGIITSWLFNTIYMLAQTGVSEEYAANRVAQFPISTPGYAVITFAMMVFFAPVFEEIFLRGLFMRALIPYGAGFAIITSALLFGLMHGNFVQLPYAFVLGICLGYISYRTGNMLVNIILHMTYNLISFIIMLFLSNPDVGKLMSGDNFSFENGTNSGWLFVFFVFCLFVILLVIFGFIMGIMKIVKIRKARKNPRQAFQKPELSVKLRAKLLISSPIFILTAVMIINIFGQNYLAEWIVYFLRV